MLKQRIITAVFMLALLVPAVFYPDSRAFAAVAVLLIAAAAWEWAKLNHCGPRAALAIGVICAALCLATWCAGGLILSLRLLWIVIGSAWVVFGAWLLRAGATAWLAVPQGVRLVGGILALWAAWMAVVQARMMGINFLFSVLVLVWVADIFAYAAGRLLGGQFFKQRLAPTISPGKTWEGVLGGMIGVVVLAFVWRLLDAGGAAQFASLYSRLGLGGYAFLVLAVLFLAVMSVVGDLVESLFKRSVGLKDSSALLPGHGGVLDRIDALLPVLPLAMMLATL